MLPALPAATTCHRAAPEQDALTWDTGQMLADVCTEEDQGDGA